MPFYLRKSLSLGPLRVNFSKSGIGLSFGVTGLRVGTGPKGKYLHAGRHGLYYRQSLEGGETTENPPQKQEKSTFQRLWPYALALGLGIVYLYQKHPEILRNIFSALA